MADKGSAILARLPDTNDRSIRSDRKNLCVTMDEFNPSRTMMATAELLEGGKHSDLHSAPTSQPFGSGWLLLLRFRMVVMRSPLTPYRLWIVPNSNQIDTIAIKTEKFNLFCWHRLLINQAHPLPPPPDNAQGTESGKEFRLSNYVLNGCFDFQAGKYRQEGWFLEIDWNRNVTRTPLD